MSKEDVEIEIQTMQKWVVEKIRTEYGKTCMTKYEDYAPHLESYLLVLIVLHILNMFDNVEN